MKREAGLAMSRALSWNVAVAWTSSLSKFSGALARHDRARVTRYADIISCTILFILLFLLSIVLFLAWEQIILFIFNPTSR